MATSCIHLQENDDHPFECPLPFAVAGFFSGSGWQAVFGTIAASQPSLCEHGKSASQRAELTDIDFNST
jgi:hypothetical protein